MKGDIATLDAPELGMRGEAEKGDGEKWQIKALNVRHKTALMAIAKGLGRQKAAEVSGYTPEYITALLRMDLPREYLGKIIDAYESQLDALFVKSVDVIGEVLETGSPKDKLSAARLQMEATKRIGRYDPTPVNTGNGNERLMTLSERLVGLLEKKWESVMVEGQARVVREHATSGENATILKEIGYEGGA